MKVVNLKYGNITIKNLYLSIGLVITNVIDVNVLLPTIITIGMDFQ